MKRMGWIALDFVLAAIVAVLGNIVASYLQERFSLTDPVRFTFVAILFVVCLGLLLLATLKRSHLEAKDPTPREAIRVEIQRRVRELRGKLVGIEVEEMTQGTAQVYDEIDTVAEGGEAIGFRAKKLGGGTVKTDQKLDRVDDGGTVTGVSIDKLG